MAVTGVADPARLLRNDAAEAGPAAHADQADRRRAAQQPAQADRRGLRGRRSRSMTAAEPRRRRRRAGRRGARRHRRHRLRPARPPAQDVPGLAASGAVIDRAAVPVVDGARRGAARRFRLRRHPPQPRLGAPAPDGRPDRPRTTCCCSPTRRPPAGCWSSARCPAIRSSATPSRARASRSAEPILLLTAARCRRAQLRAQPAVVMESSVMPAARRAASRRFCGSIGVARVAGRCYARLEDTEPSAAPTPSSSARPDTAAATAVTPAEQRARDHRRRRAVRSTRSSRPGVPWCSGSPVTGSIRVLHEPGGDQVTDRTDDSQRAGGPGLARSGW